MPLIMYTSVRALWCSIGVPLGANHNFGVQFNEAPGANQVSVGLAVLSVKDALSASEKISTQLLEACITWQFDM